MESKAKNQLRVVPRKRSIKTRQAIIDAALTIIARAGVRAITHRIVASEAQVSLGSTTYYFKNIDDLVASSFEHWQLHAQRVLTPHAETVINDLQGLFDNKPASPTQLADRLSKYAITFVKEQVTHDKENRIIELAFYHEALYNERVCDLVRENIQRELDILEVIFSYFSPSTAKLDAEIMLSVFHQLERRALLDDDAKGNLLHNKNLLKRHFEIYFATAR